MSIKFRALNYLNARESKLNIDGILSELPIIYSTFISSFHLGYELNFLRPIRVMPKVSQEIIEIRWENSKEKNPWRIEGDRLLDLLTVDDLKNELGEYQKVIDRWHQCGMIKIGSTHGEVVLLGVQSNILDKIFLYGEGDAVDNVEIKEIANNIFDILCKLELAPDIYLMGYYGIEVENLYQNFGEDLWRIRE